MSTIRIDKGWAWGVPIGGFIANFIVGGLAKSFGIIMGSTQDLLYSSAAPLTLAGGLIYTFMYCLSPISILLCQKFGYRLIINLGSAGCVLSFILAFFATNVTMWVIAIGGGIGISLGFIYSPIFVMVGRCFHNRVGVAMGVSVAGVSIGQIAFPSIITVLIEKYTVRGAYLVGAGIACHFFITAALMPRYIQDEIANKPKNGGVKNGVKNGLANKEIEKVPLKEIENGNLWNEKDSETMNTKKPKKPSTFKRIHIVMLIVFTAAKVFGDVGDVGIAFALPPYGEKSLDMNNQDISRAIAVAGVVDLVARIIIGFISDQPWCRRSLILNAAWLLEAFTAFFFVWFQDYVSYFILYGIFGLCSGTAITLMTVVLTDFVGKLNLPIAFAIMMFVLGLFIGGGQFLVGYLADITGSFAVSLKFLGFNMFAAFILLSLEYPLKYFVFNTTSAIADDIKQCKSKTNTKNHLNVEENQHLVTEIDPNKDRLSQLSSIQT